VTNASMSLGRFCAAAALEQTIAESMRSPVQKVLNILLTNLKKERGAHHIQTSERSNIQLRGVATRPRSANACEHGGLTKLAQSEHTWLG